MKVIWKLEPPTRGTFSFELPASAEMLKVGAQDDSPRIWVMFDPNEERIVRTFEFFGTGHPIDETPRKYIDTVLLYDDELVLHLFELTT